MNHSIQSSSLPLGIFFIHRGKATVVKDSLISELKMRVFNQKVRNHRNYEILSEELYRKMPLSDLEASTVD